MNLSDIQFLFNRSLNHTFSKKKLLVVFLTLVFSGLLVVFFKAISLNTGAWISLSLTFIPVFICAGVLLAIGVLLTRVYHDEIKQKEFSYRKTFAKSWDVIIGTAYLSIPMILGYLVLWMLLGIFFLLNDLPTIGGFFSIILAFAPFLLNLGALLLCLLSLSLLFFVTPVVALRGLNHIQLAQIVAKRFQSNLFLNLFLATIAVTPFLVASGLLTIATLLTGSICYHCDQPLYLIIQWFFLMIPITALLSPTIVFFFNFAAESHVYLLKR